MSDQLNSIKRSIYILAAVNVMGVLGMLIVAWAVHLGIVPLLTSKVGDLIAVYFAVVAIANTFTTVYWFVTLAKGASDAKELIRSKKHKDSRQVRMIALPLCNAVGCWVEQKNAAGDVKKGSGLFMIGLASELPPTQLQSLLAYNVPRPAPSDVTALLDANGKVRLLLQDKLVILVAMVYPPIFSVLLERMSRAVKEPSKKS